jgi:hypothetical protein
MQPNQNQSRRSVVSEREKVNLLFTDGCKWQVYICLHPSSLKQIKYNKQTSLTDLHVNTLSNELKCSHKHGLLKVIRCLKASGSLQRYLIIVRLFYDSQDASFWLSASSVWLFLGLLFVPRIEGHIFLRNVGEIYRSTGHNISEGITFNIKNDLFYFNLFCFSLLYGLREKTIWVCSNLLKLFPRSWIFLPWSWRRYVPPKCRFTQDLYGVIFQKTTFVIVTAVKTSDLTINLVVAKMQGNRKVPTPKKKSNRCCF